MTAERTHDTVESCCGRYCGSPAIRFVLGANSLAPASGVPRHRTARRLALLTLGLLTAALAGCTLTGGATQSANAPRAPTATWSLVALGDSIPAGTACDCEPYPQLSASDLSLPGGTCGHGFKRGGQRIHQPRRAPPAEQRKRRDRLGQGCALGGDRSGRERRVAFQLVRNGRGLLSAQDHGSPREPARHREPRARAHRRPCGERGAAGLLERLAGRPSMHTSRARPTQTRRPASPTRSTR